MEGLPTAVIHRASFANAATSAAKVSRGTQFGP
jgi:hypothetical protein